MNEQYTSRKDAERLARLETELEGIGKTVEKIDVKLDFFNQQYMPRSEIEEKFRTRDNDISDLRDMIKDLKNSFHDGIREVSKTFQQQLQEREDARHRSSRLVAVWVSAITSLLVVILSLLTFQI